MNKHIPMPKQGKKLVIALVAIFAITPSFATEGNFFGEIGEFLNNLDVEFSITAPVIQQPRIIRQPTIIRQPVIQRPVIQRPVIQQPVVIQRPVIQRPVVQQPVIVRQPVYVPVQPSQPRYIPYNGGTYGNGYSNTNGQYSSQVTVSTTPYSGGSYSSGSTVSTGYAPVNTNGYTTVTYSGASSSSSALSNGYFNLVPGEGYVVGYGMAMTLLDIGTNRYGDTELLLAFSYEGQTRHVNVSIPHGEQPVLKVGGKRLQLVGLEHNHGNQYIRCFLAD